MTDPAGLVDAVRAGDRGALARLLSVVEAGGDEARAALAELPVSAADAAWTVGITGAPGAGKSTLTAALVRHLRARGVRVGVLAVDPTQPVHRRRDPRRPRAHARPHHRSRRLHPVDGDPRPPGRPRPRRCPRRSACSRRRATASSWWRRSASGRSRSGIAGTADTTVVVVNPGWGDGVQAAKAGLLEIGDVFVVNKADRDGVAATVHDLQAMLELAGARAWRPPVLETVATEDRGVDALLDAIERHRAESGGLRRARSTPRTAHSGRNSCTGP